MGTTWLITREADDARSERDAILVPCVETKILPWPWPTLPSRAPVSLSPAGERVGERALQITFFTSRRSVTSWKTSRAPLEEVASLSPATSEALMKEGITPTITSEGGVVALAEAVVRLSHATNIRYPTSNAGLASPEQAEALRIMSKLGEVDRRVAYEVTAPVGLRQSLESAAVGDWSISFASPSAVHHFFASGALIPRGPRYVDCLGAATERAWNTARPGGWPPAVNSRATAAEPPTTEVTS